MTIKNNSETRDAFATLQNHPAIEHELEVPVVNLNGATADSLLQQYLAIHHALNAVQTAMAEATPHGRDFQTVADHMTTVDRARKAFTERRQLLRLIASELEAVYMAIHEQGQERRHQVHKIPVRTGMPIVRGDPINDQLDIDIPPAADKA